MSTSQFAVGFVAVLGLGQLGLTSILPEPKPITVHSLTYVNGSIIQDRTAVADGDYFPAQWRAFIFDTVTNKPVPECTGTGFSPYHSGRIAVNLKLTEWTGRDECTPEFLRERGGTYYPVASWHWGNDFEKATGGVFEP